MSTTHARFAAFARLTETGVVDAERTLFFERWSHEVFHYLQFFGCGYVTRICAEHYDTVRRHAPFPFTTESLTSYLRSRVPRPVELNMQRAELCDTRHGNISALHIIEGCAYLFQLLSSTTQRLHGAVLLALSRSPRSELYGRLYEEVAIRIGGRAINETLPIGLCALQFKEPQHAIHTLLQLASDNAPIDEDDVVGWIMELRAAAARDHELLGTALDVAVTGHVRHPLLESKWIFHEAQDWNDSIIFALSGHDESVLGKIIQHVPIHLSDAIWFPRGAAARDALEAQHLLARLSFHLGGGAMEEVTHV